MDNAKDEPTYEDKRKYLECCFIRWSINELLEKEGKPLRLSSYYNDEGNKAFDAGWRPTAAIFDELVPIGTEVSLEEAIRRLDLYFR